MRFSVESDTKNAGPPALDAALPELIDLLRLGLSSRTPALFDDVLKAELYRHLGSKEAVNLIEFQCAVGQYGDTYHHTRRAALARAALKREGYRFSAGKRPRQSLEKFTSDISRTLLFFGVSFGTGEYSRLVQCLRRIADSLSIPGDPRHELRRLRKMRARQVQRTQSVMYAALAQGLWPALRGSPVHCK